MSDTWQTVLVAGLTVNAVIGFVYRLYRYQKGGPLPDLIGQAILGAVLVGIAAAAALDWNWSRWAAAFYGLLFGLAVMPVWVLGVLLPLRPGAIDYTFTVLYWTTLGAIVVAAVAA